MGRVSTLRAARFRPQTCVGEAGVERTTFLTRRVIAGQSYLMGPQTYLLFKCIPNGRSGLAAQKRFVAALLCDVLGVARF